MRAKAAVKVREPSMAASTHGDPGSQAPAPATLDGYLAERAEERRRTFAPKPGEPAARRLAKRVFPAPLRMSPRLAATRALRSRERRRLAELPRPLRLHLGSGNEHKDGWVNVDLAGYPVEAAWNLARPLPLPDGSVEAIFHEHLLEHLMLEEGLAFCRECHRLLRPGGVLRIGVPDAGAAARSYAGDPGAFLEQARPGRPTAMLALQELFYYPGHRTMYDFETLALLLRAAGFDRPEQRAFGETALEPPPDSTHRRAETLYVEARR
jgi:predicted SAM-dependent methyltransferase